MNFTQNIILGVIQGITEWLPISSEGISTLIQINFFHMYFKEALYQSIWLHTGTLIAAIIYFRSELWNITKHIPTYFRTIGKQTAVSKPGNTINYLLIAIIASAALGAPLFLLIIDKVQLPAAIITAIIGLFLIITGIAQKLSQGINVSGPERSVGWKESIVTGIAQGFSILPGISRSGMTVSTLLFFRYNASQALKLSFLLSVPAVFIAELAVIFTEKVTFGTTDIVGLVSSFVVGLLAIYGFMKLAVKIPFWGFCIFFGLLSFVPWLLTR